jgi:hypothetical protein
MGTRKKKSGVAQLVSVSTVQQTEIILPTADFGGARIVIEADRNEDTQVTTGNHRVTLRETNGDSVLGILSTEELYEIGSAFINYADPS